MNNKVKFLRGTSGEYAVAEKDSDAIYFTTDDGKLYIGDKEVSGSDITIDTTLSDTSENPVQNKVVKKAIDNKADKTVATVSADGLMSAEDKGKLDAFEITTTGGKLHDKNIATTDDIPDLTPYAKTADVPNIKVNAAVNADTVGGKLPDKIFYENGMSSDLDSATESGCYAASPDALNVPYSMWWLVDTMNHNGQFIVQKAHTIGNTANTISYIRNYANNAWSDWTEIYTAGNKPYVANVFGGTAVDIHLDYEPSFAIVSDEGNIKFGYSLISSGGGYDVKFENLSDTTHQYIIFK